MIYRTRTYIAGDWTGDEDLISALQHWNESSYWSISFTDAHELTQARDTSLSCSVKRSLKERLDVSKTFVLIVGNDTKKLTKGSCRYCRSYSVYGGCHRQETVDHRSFIEYECDYASKHALNTVVLYNSCCVDRNKCPDSLKYTGRHLAAVYHGAGGRYYWDINAIKQAICG